MPRPEVDVHATTNGTFPVLPLPPSNASKAPVPPTLEAEGIATTLPPESEPVFTVSPNGVPVLSPRYAPYAAAAVVVAAVVRRMVPAGSVVQGIAETVVELGAAFGILSAGARK